jgi:glycosyltransferase involved in cell wall biosynthesis
VATTRAIELARGRYVALLDGDDEWLPDKLARQLGLLEERPEVALVHADLEVIDSAGRLINSSKYDWSGHLPVVGRALGRLLTINEAITSTIVVRVEVAKRLPPARGLLRLPRRASSCCRGSGPARAGPQPLVVWRSRRVTRGRDQDLCSAVGWRPGMG